jgi:protein phosphatase 1 regulatory subunit 3A/B/C/D/E
MNVEECLNALENLTAGMGKHGKSGPVPGPLISLSMADIDLQEAPPSPTVMSPEDEDTPEEDSGGFYGYEDREFDFLKTEPVRRSTSLKTYKTPPGTPRRKKAVRFADALGLDLESVRHILNLEAPPKVPDSALKDLKIGLEEEHKTEGSRYLTACFSQPGADPDFLARVVAEKVVLENCLVDDRTLTVSGSIRVANITFHKKVSVRYSINGWMTYTDIEASYVHNSSDGKTDRFSFSIYLPPYFNRGSRLEFALMFLDDGTTYWDNNYGRNYHVECYAKNIPTADHDSNWMHFL